LVGLLSLLVMTTPDFSPYAKQYVLFQGINDIMSSPQSFLPPAQTVQKKRIRWSADSKQRSWAVFPPPSAPMSSQRKNGQASYSIRRFRPSASQEGPNHQNDLAIGLSFGPFEVFFFIKHHLCSNTDYKSTDYSMKYQFEYILRKLLIILNAIVRTSTAWHPEPSGQAWHSTQLLSLFPLL